MSFTLFDHCVSKHCFDFWTGFERWPNNTSSWVKTRRGRGFYTIIFKFRLTLIAITRGPGRNSRQKHLRICTLRKLLCVKFWRCPNFVFCPNRFIKFYTLKLRAQKPTRYLFDWLLYNLAASDSSFFSNSIVEQIVFDYRAGIRQFWSRINVKIAGLFTMAKCKIIMFKTQH